MLPSRREGAAKKAVIETKWRIYLTFNHEVAKLFGADDLPAFSIAPNTCWPLMSTGS
jgi:hypothetical protein